MNKNSLLFAAVALFTLSMTGCNGGGGDTPVKSDTVEIVDIYDRTVELPKDVKSVICVGASALRMYSYVADLDKIISVEKIEKIKPGIDYNKPGERLSCAYKFADFRSHPQLQELPVIGRGGPKARPQSEFLINHNPDVVFWSSYDKDIDVEKYERECGCKFVRITPGPTEFYGPTLEKSLSIIGKVMNTEKRAQEVIDYMRGMEKNISESVETYRKEHEITLENEPQVYIGAISFRGPRSIFCSHPTYPVFKMAKVRNWCDGKVEHKIDSMVDISPELLIGENGPDRIILDSGGLNFVKETYSESDKAETLDNITAIKNGEVFFQLPYRYYAVNIENAWCNAYTIAEAAYPGLFGKDFSFDKKANEIYKKFYGESLYSNPELPNDIKRGNFGGFQKITNLKAWLNENIK